MENQIELLEFISEDGHNPFRNWIRDIKDDKTRARIRIRLNRIRLGNFGDCKSVGKGVNELRISFGAGYRVYYGKSRNDIVILLCGGDKGTQSKDIKIAQKYWSEYKRRIA